ncbi:MAG: hypothetical protein WBG19_08375 [Thermoplasmata archaeon]
MKLTGTPVELDGYSAESVTNPQFGSFDISRLDRVYLPPGMRPLADEPPLETKTFIEDDNRGAIHPDPVATLDGRAFYLSVKGVGSAVDPYSNRPLDRSAAAALTDDPELRERLGRPPADRDPRLITGELWLRGSPYGGQGIEHAMTALRVSERADLTSLHGFLIAPVVKVCYLPRPIEERVRRIFWYRQYPGRIVQEIRLVPSNVRIYFHAKHTVGTSIRHLFDLFGLTRSASAVAFETNFVRSTVALLTLYARTLAFDAERGRCTGLDFHDVWLDKDAVIAPDGAVYFVDLEGIEEVALEEEFVREKIEDQIYRSLYEFMFAFEQVEQERVRRFGSPPDRRSHFERILEEALRDDPFVRLRRDGPHLEMIVRNLASKENLYLGFRMVDR